MFGFVIGLWLIMVFYFGWVTVTGFLAIKRNRVADDIATSKIATGAVGSHVEIKGKVITDDNKILLSPGTKTSCVLYHSNIQEIGPTWSHSWFCLDDGSGALALIFVNKARLRESWNRRGYI